MLHARIGDDVVFPALLVLRVREGERLVRDHADFGDDRAGLLGDADRARLSVSGSGVGVVALPDEEERLVVLHLRRLHDGHPVFPHRLVDIGFRAPGLRCHLEDKGGVAVAGFCRDQLPFVGGVGLGDVGIERGLLVGLDAVVGGGWRGGGFGRRDRGGAAGEECCGACECKQCSADHGGPPERLWSPFERSVGVEARHRKLP